MTRPANILFLVILTCCVGLFTFCSRDVLDDLPSYTEEQVINCFIRKDTVLVLSLSRSSEINGKGFNRIDNADIVLFKNDEFFDSLKTAGDGIYISNREITESAEYSISASYYNNILFAQDRLPSEPILLNINRTDRAGIDAEGHFYGSVEIKLYDQLLNQDFYEIELIYISTIRASRNPLYPRSSTEKVLLNENLPQVSSVGYFPFSDELFNGDTVNIHFDYYTSRAINNGVEEELDPDYLLVAKFRKTSESYYHYRKSVINHYDGQQPDFWNGTGNQTNIYSNIEGGLGIFAGYSEIVDTLYKSSQ